MKSRSITYGHTEDGNIKKHKKTVIMIRIKHFVVNEFQVNAFVLYDETNEAVIIDGAVKFDNEIDAIKSFIKENSLNVKYIINTHGHVDHICGNSKLKESYDVPVLMHKEDEFLIETAVSHAQSYGLSIDKQPMPDENIEDNQKIKFGNSELDCILVPGHTPGSIAFYSKEDSFLITGDALFAGSIGRTDLPKGDYNTLISSIKNRLMTLPEDTKVYCGHGPETSIGSEKRNNPFL